MFKTIEWTSDGVRMIDQTRLPGEEVYRTCRSYQEVAEAIRSMVIRGAPAIGVAAAMGVALGIRGTSGERARKRFATVALVVSLARSVSSRYGSPKLGISESSTPTNGCAMVPWM